MKHLIIVAHGSRREASNEEIRALTRKIAGISAPDFDDVQCAFLELADPSIPDGIQCAIDRGARDVVVLPYFLSAGRHVASDIPGEVEQVQARNPGISISIAPYLGSMESMAHLMLEQARRATTA